MMTKKNYFTDYFNLNLDTEQLDFVNIPLFTDIQLYIDPCTISQSKDLFGKQVNNIIVDFFEKLLDSIRCNDEITSFRLLSKLREPNETHFGLSARKPDGCGIGILQAKFLYDKLKQSKAFRTGNLSDLSDCELLIEGIGSDKISDISTNIIRGKLVEYTEEQCKKLEIRVRKIKTRYYWSLEHHIWEQRFAYLPFYKNEPILLVPKRFVRKKTISNYYNFYNNIIIPHLQEQHLNLNTGLVRLLKSGKRIVYKKDIKKQTKCTKPFVLEFINANPTLLKKYKEGVLG